MSNERIKGKVKWFNNAKGYGFLTTPDGKDTFIHFSGILMEGYKTLKDNQEVEFEVTKGEKGLQAINCTPVAAKSQETK